MDNKEYITLGPSTFGIIESNFTDNNSKYPNGYELTVITDDYSQTNGFYFSCNGHWVKYKK